MKSHIGRAMLAGALVASGAAAAAETNLPESVDIRSLSVPYESSEIRDEESAEDLFFRIRQAAAEVCNIASFPRGYEIWYEHDCETEAVSEAVDEVNEPVLDEYYTDLGGSATPR